MQQGSASPKGWEGVQGGGGRKESVPQPHCGNFYIDWVKETLLLRFKALYLFSMKGMIGKKTEV